MEITGLEITSNEVNEVVQEILDISGLSTILDVKKTEEEALSTL